MLLAKEMLKNLIAALIKIPSIIPVNIKSIDTDLITVTLSSVFISYSNKHNIMQISIIIPIGLTVKEYKIKKKRMNGYRVII